MLLAYLSTQFIFLFMWSKLISHVADLFHCCYMFISPGDGLIHEYAINCCDTYICVKIQIYACTVTCTLVLVWCFKYSVPSYHLYSINVGAPKLDIRRLCCVFCLISRLKMHIFYNNVQVCVPNIRSVACCVPSLCLVRTD